MIPNVMVSRSVPPYKNIAMAKKTDPKSLVIAQKYTKNDQIPISSLKRFLDDVFSIWYGATKDLQKFFKDINDIHPNVKFTSSNNETHEDKCKCKQKASIFSPGQVPFHQKQENISRPLP